MFGFIDRRVRGARRIGLLPIALCLILAAPVRGDDPSSESASDREAAPGSVPRSDSEPSSESEPRSEPASESEPASSSESASGPGTATESAPASESESSALKVGQVSVTATRAERDVLDVASNVTVIDREEIERSGLRDVPELLRRHAGVYFTNTTSSPEGYGMEIRGFNDGGGGGSSTLVLVDGRRINEPDSSNVDWASLRLDDVERIEIVRGPASAAWGDNAVGGVVQIFTRRGKGDAQATLKGRAGSYDNYGGSFYAGGSRGPITASLFADGVDSDNYRHRADFWSAQMESSLRVALGENLSMQLSGGYLEDERDRPGALSSMQIRDLGRRAANPATTGDVLKRNRNHVDGYIEWTPRKNVLFTLHPYYQEREDDGQITAPQDDDDGDPTTPPPAWRFLNDTQTETFGINPQGQIDSNWNWATNRLIFGSDILRDVIHVKTDSLDTGTGASFPSNQKSKRRIYAGYVQDELDIAKRVTLSAGLRYDSTEIVGRDLIYGSRFETANDDDDFWSPKAGIVLRLCADASAYFSYAKGFRLPNVDEAFGYFGFNEGLKPERSNSYEFGLKLRAEKLHFDVAFYRLDVEDEILFDHEIDGFFGAYPYSVNIDRVRHQGVELSGRIFPWKWLEIYGSYTYEDNEIRSDDFALVPGEMRRSIAGNRLPITPEHRGSFGVIATLPYWIELAFNGNITGSRYAANDLLNEYSKLSSFAVYDLLAAFRPTIGEHVELDFEFRVMNLFNEKYAEFGGERTFARGELGYFPSPTRNYMGTFGITVKR